MGRRSEVAAENAAGILERRVLRRRHLRRGVLPRPPSRLWTAPLNTEALLGFAAGAAVVAATTMTSTLLWGVDGDWRIPFRLA
ncbi:MAG TPA: hypothetical protein VJQ61_14255 [Sinomonas sp.]|nr:hypothetical protein [Sinomonas sp.]